MKRTFLLAAVALLLGASVKAQSTVDSIAAKYKLQPMPAPLTIEKTFPALGTYQLTNAATDANATTASNVTITLDSANKGIVWVEGLPEGRMKAYLRKSPSTYRIISQKSESGKQISEGTLMYDTTAHTLNIALGKAYDEVDPAAIFALNPATNGGVTSEPVVTEPVKVKTKTKTSKTKAKVTYYTASKVMMDQNQNTTTQPSTNGSFQDNLNNSTNTTNPADSTNGTTNPNPAPQQ